MPERASIEIFDPQRSAQYVLSIRLSTDGFYFIVYSPQHSRFLLSTFRKPDSSGSYFSSLKSAFCELSFLNYPYKQVQVLVVDKRFTMVPLELFEENEARQIFDYNFTTKDNETIHTNMLVNNSCAMLFGVDKHIGNYINQIHPNTYYYAHTTPMLEHFSVKSRSSRVKQLFACLRNEYVDVYCFDRGYVLLVNSFGKCHTEVDYSYYILLVWKQLAMDQLNDELYITGDTGGKTELLDILRNYVRKTSVLETRTDANHSFAENIDRVPYDIQVLMSQNKDK